MSPQDQLSLLAKCMVDTLVGSLNLTQEEAQAAMRATQSFRFDELSEIMRTYEKEGDTGAAAVRRFIREHSGGGESCG